MSGHDKQRQSQTTVTTTGTTTQTERDQGFDALTLQEERVLRMLHGLTEEDDHVLKFALGADEEVSARLALMEHHLLRLFKGGPNEELMEVIRELQAGLTPAGETP